MVRGNEAREKEESTKNGNASGIFNFLLPSAFDTFDSLIKKGNKFNSIDFSNALSFNEAALGSIFTQRQKKHLRRMEKNAQ